MSITFQTVVTFSDGFRDVLKRQRYEEIVLATINKSQSLIGNLPLSRVIEQSNNESDYLDAKGKKYDVKLLLDSEQGSLIGERKNDLRKWLYSMMNECGEFYDCIRSRDMDIVRNSRLYDILKKRLLSIRADEVAILFCPYPVVNDYQHGVHMQFATDFLQAVVNELEEEINACQGVYFLYPSMDKGIMVLREANTKAKEYIKAPEIEEYISFDTMAVVE